jgi:hypothetical protein
MRVGIICEGKTDFVVLEALALALGGATECVLLQPDFDRLKARDFLSGTGWQAVRKYLRQNAVALGLGVYDLLVVHVDASIRHKHELQKAKLRAADPDEAELAPLCEHVRSWAGGGLPEGAIIALPREELESWLVAAHTNIKDVEAVTDPAEELAVRGLVARFEDGTPEKTEERYTALRDPLVALARDRRKRAAIAELERFVVKLDAARRRHAASRKARR